MLILGMLHRGNLHPYEMKRRLQGAMIDCYLDVDTGSLYYAVRQLERDGATVAVAQERVARGGVRTIYAITDAGRAEFDRGFYRQFEEDGPVSQTLYGALLFLQWAVPERLAPILRRRIARLDDLIAKLDPIAADMAPRIGTGGKHLLRHIGYQRRLDREWLQGLLADVEAGRVHDAPAFVEAGQAD